MTPGAIFATMAGMDGFGTNPRRYLCSQLVTLIFNGESRVVNLEEICRTGALLECDQPVSSGIHAEITTGNVHFHGTVTDVEEHELGWRIEVEFSPMTPWSPETFQPQHLLDPSSMQD